MCSWRRREEEKGGELEEREGELELIQNEGLRSSRDARKLTSIEPVGSTLPNDLF